MEEAPNTSTRVDDSETSLKQFLGIDTISSGGFQSSFSQTTSTEATTTTSTTTTSTTTATTTTSITASTTTTTSTTTSTTTTTTTTRTPVVKNDYDILEVVKKESYFKSRFEGNLPQSANIDTALWYDLSLLNKFKGNHTETRKWIMKAVLKYIALFILNQSFLEFFLSCS